MMEVLSHDELTRMIETLWGIWYARRKLIHEGINQSPLTTHMFVNNFISELEQLKSPSDTHEMLAPRRAQERGPWLSPPAGYVKINADVGVSIDRNLGTAAAICRDRDVIYLA